MKRMSTKFFLYSLTSLAVTASSVAYAETPATAPTLEGGFYAAAAALYLTPSSNNQGYAVSRSFTPGSIGSGLVDFGTTHANTLNVNGDYDWGFEATLGYAFDNTANSIELNYRGLNSNDSQHSRETLFLIPNAWDVAADQKNEFQNWDLMISQFLDIGTHFQMRFLGGLSYLSELEQRNSVDALFDAFDPLFITDIGVQHESSYSGWGPRVGVDGRYEFGDGFGILGGGSVAYFLGDLDSTRTSRIDTITLEAVDFHAGANNSSSPDNHNVTNLRGNLGIDYVYYFDNNAMSSLGLELGYQVDTYLDGVSQVDSLNNLTTTDLSFSGPYLNLKGAF